LPVQVGLDAPVEAQSCHDNHHEDPEDLTKDRLVVEEDVDEALE